MITVLINIDTKIVYFNSFISEILAVFQILLCRIHRIVIFVEYDVIHRRIIVWSRDKCELWNRKYIRVDTIERKNLFSSIIFESWETGKW